MPVSNDLYAYDLETGNWSIAEVKGGSAPSPRLAHTAGAIGSKLYVYGGRYHNAATTLHA